MTPALVSVIVPCYNQAQYLPDALNSILAQTYTNWECIIVNDGSPDNTEEVAMEWVARDHRFKYLKKENGGLSSARNAGLAKVQGDFIQFLDADDVIHAEKFTIQINALADTPDNALSISSYFSSIESDLKVPHPTRFMTPQFKTQNYISELISKWEFSLSIPVHCFLFKSQLFKSKNILFNEQLPNHEDWDCWMNIFKLGPVVKYTDLKLATYRIRENAMCYDQKQMQYGYLMALNIQKDNFHKNSNEYKLLIKKHNFVKYGVNSVNPLIIYLGVINKKGRLIASKAYRSLKKYLQL